MRLLQPASMKRKISKEKSTEKLSCWNPHLRKYDRHTEMWQEADLPKRFSTACSLPLFVGHTKGRNGLCPTAKFTKGRHNLFLPKTRRISARQLNHLNDNRKVCPTRKNKCFLWSDSTFYLSLHQ